MDQLTPEPSLTRTLLPVGVTGVVMLSMVGLCSGYPCVTTGVQYGLWLDQCPATQLRASGSLNAWQLQREAWGSARVVTTANWMSATGPSGNRKSAPVGRPNVLLDLVDGSGELVPGVKLREPSWSDDALKVDVWLPTVPDGNYRLRAKVDAGFETIEMFADVPLFTPALVHVVSDRPLYKPGQEVLLRAAVLSRADSTPIDTRPGTWRIRSPDGTEMLQESSHTDAWGVSSTTFPLAADAEEGQWTAVFDTGSDSRTLAFDVRPFKLPRFTVDVASNQTWYAMGESIELTGTARYTSGAPVADAKVEVAIRPSSGRWPRPLAWEEPLYATTDAQGRFSLDVGTVPGDLVDRAILQAVVSVTDAAGERRSGGKPLTLSADDLYVETVTAFQGGLVQDFNNRAYLRVMTPDGQPLRNTDVVVRNPFQPIEPEMNATTDEDGVAALQLDPGEPVTLVTPPPPVRLRPFAPADPYVQTAEVFPGARPLSLSERRSLDRLHPGIARCGELSVNSSAVGVGVQVSPSGRVTGVQSADDALGDCVAGVMRQAVFEPDELRSMRLTWSVPDALLPSLDLDLVSINGPASRAQKTLSEAARFARRCFTRGVGVQNAPVVHLQWSHAEDAARLQTVVSVQRRTGLSAGVLACVERALSAPAFRKPPAFAAMGAASFTLEVPLPPGSNRPSATTSTGFQLAVEAKRPAGVLGRTKVTFTQGYLPPLRLRVSPSLASPGDSLEVEMLRGPDFVGDLPRKLVLRKGERVVAKADLNKKTRKATFVVPKDEDGFLSVEAGAWSAVVFVQPDDALSVSLATDATTYRPGETAKLTVTTRSGPNPTDASVTLAGVDSALSQLMPLTSPDDWGDVTVRATGEDAFGSFGPRALQLGQVQGENAAKAAVLLVQDLPRDAAQSRVSAAANHDPPIAEEQITQFYRALEALVVKVRAWEKSAPADEFVGPPVIAKLWDAVLAEGVSSGNPIVDGFGRPLTLQLLPDDLLEQTNPSQVVSDSTRLPEDVINWADWVRSNP